MLKKAFQYVQCLNVLLGYPHCAHLDFWMWYEERPHLLHNVWVLLRRLPKLEVPLVCKQKKAILTDLTWTNIIITDLSIKNIFFYLMINKFYCIPWLWKHCFFWSIPQHTLSENSIVVFICVSTWLVSCPRKSTRLKYSLKVS